MTQPLTFRLDHRFPIAVVRLRGELTPPTGAVVRTAILAALVDEPTSVIVDLARLTVTDDLALQVFAGAAGQAAHWPGARLLLCRAPAAVAAALARADVVRDLPVFPTLEAALAEAAAEPVPQRVRQRLEPTIYAPRAGRELAADACARWGLPDSAVPAEILASELVTNAVRHAGTVLDLRITLRDQQLRVSVHDRAAGPLARKQHPGEADDHGRGLLIVDAVATEWGNVPVPDGKVVWASLWVAPNPPPGPGRRRPGRLTHLLGWMDRGHGINCRGPRRWRTLPGMPARRTLFAGGRVFDGTGSDPQPADVVVAGGRIIDVGTGLDGDQSVDCTGQVLLPGMFDCHVHLMVNGLDPLGLRHQPFSLRFYHAVDTMRATLAAGITTVREASGADLGVQEAQRQGLVAGPRMQISIALIHQTGGHGDPWEPSGSSSPIFPPHPGRPDGTVDGADQARRKVRELVRAGAGVIKIATSGGVLSPRSDPRHGHFRDAEVAAIVEEAAAAGLAVMAHAQATDGIKTAVRNGVRSIEHGIYLDDEAIELMLARGTWLVPTLMAPRGVFAAAEAGVPIPAHVLDKATMVADAHGESVRRAIAAGVRVAMGTDSGVTPHGRNLEELALLVEAGMSPAQALHSATCSAAQLLGLAEELGTITPGRRADLVRVDGDPFELATLPDRIGQVYQDGALVHQREPEKAVDQPA